MLFIKKVTRRKRRNSRVKYKYPGSVNNRNEKTWNEYLSRGARTTTMPEQKSVVNIKNKYSISETHGINPPT